MSKIKWLSVDDPKEIYQNNQTSIVFKHSPRCIISKIVLKNLNTIMLHHQKLIIFIW